MGFIHYRYFSFKPVNLKLTTYRLRAGNTNTAMMPNKCVSRDSLPYIGRGFISLEIEFFFGLFLLRVRNFEGFDDLSQNEVIENMTIREVAD